MTVFPAPLKLGIATGLDPANEMGTEMILSLQAEALRAHCVCFSCLRDRGHMCQLGSLSDHS